MMKKRYILYLLTIVLIGCYGKPNIQTFTINDSLSLNVISEDSICDSIFNGAFDPPLIERYDTIINGTKYAYALVLSEEYTFVCLTRSKEYSMLHAPKVLYKGEAFLIDMGSDDYYYEIFVPSPNRNYLYALQYYETGVPQEDSNEILETILRFRGGCIFDVRNCKIVDSFSSFHENSYWTDCNQWIEDGEIYFDSNDRTEDIKNQKEN